VVNVSPKEGQSRTLTRAELMEMIWRAPAVSVAPNLGLSDVGLAKICRKHAIPRPGRGYWAKKAAGKPVPVAVLPPSPRPDLETIVINACRVPSVVAEVRSRESSEIEVVCRYEADPRNRIEVPEKVGRYHPIIGLSRATFKKRSHLDKYHRLYTPAEDVFEVSVSKIQLSRAFRIADTVLKALERRGWKLSVEGPHGCRTSLFGQAVALSIVETSKRIPYEPTPEERAQFERTGYRWYKTIDYQPTGRLRLCGDRHLNSSGVEVVDTAGKPLEERLNEFVVLLTRCAWQHRCDELESTAMHRPSARS